MTKESLIKEIGKHSIYKFQLIEKYVEEWAHIMLNNKYCNELVFIDCMCNCGEYIYKGEHVFGTPVRVSDVLQKIAKQYSNKKIQLYFNDWNKDKINHLSTLLPKNDNLENLQIHLSDIDGNELIKKLGSEIKKKTNIHYLLIYDPFQADIDWDALNPFLNNWGEVIINHMVSDSIRAIKMVKEEDKKKKYEKTYMSDIDELIKFGSDKEKYEQKIIEIINKQRHKTSNFYIASFPFFNSKNALEYNLIHCTGHVEGFKLYKKWAWKVFGDHSSNKNIYGKDKLYQLDFENEGTKFFEDQNCYTIHNIAEYVYNMFKNYKEVPINIIWKLLEFHPIFPEEGFRRKIKQELKKEYNVVEKNKKIIFNGENK